MLASGFAEMLIRILLCFAVIYIISFLILYFFISVIGDYPC